MAELLSALRWIQSSRKELRELNSMERENVDEIGEKL